MAKFNFSEKWKKRSVAAFSLALAATLSMGLFTACGTTTDSTDDDDNTSVAPADTQLLKNGNFEFYGDKTIEDKKAKYNIINTPSNWSFTSGSPSSETKSGVIDTKDWDYYTKTGGSSFFSGLNSEEKPSFESVLADAYAQWEADNVSAYDRLKFLDLYHDEIEALEASRDEKKLFSKYAYSIDYDDVKDLREDLGDSVALHSGVKDDDTNVLMIHNSKVSDSVRGTAQSYTSSTTITLAAGTSAQISVWVKTAGLYHYEDTPVSARAGAYIGIKNTVGGTSLDDMQIYNINTDGQWRQYTVYVRASTFATTTIRLVLGLGQGASDDRYYHVDGYALFDDAECKIISNAEYETKTENVASCNVDSPKELKRFDTDTTTDLSFALDLYAPFDADSALLGDNVEIDLTKQTSGRKVYTSADASRGKADDDFTQVATLAQLSASDNPYLKKIYQNDFDGKFPFEESTPTVMLLSSNGAAYTAKITSELFTLDPDQRMLVSFFVKTSEIASGLSGASATVVDGENRTRINAFDSTTVPAVDIDSKSDDEAMKDIYDGWVQCFFFLQNDTEDQQTFSIELSYGPTTIVGTTKFSYGDGYAAFTNFETKPLNKTEYSYASTGDRAVKVSLTGTVEDNKQFDSVSATDEKTLETGLARPANFQGVLGGSDFVQKNDPSVPNLKPDGVFTGLLNYKNAEKYFASEEEWKTLLDGAANGATDPNAWWTNLFGNARQPLVILNRDAASYGYFAEPATVSASSSQKITLRVKASIGAKAYIYLTDVSSAEKSGNLIYPNLPGITYWYDDDGNIVSKDPADESFNKKTDVLYELQENGLYKKAGDAGNTFYANLYNYEKDENGNLITKDGSIVFYNNAGDFFAYYDEETNAYDVKVTALPTDIAHYDYASADLPGTRIVVEGTGDWVTVSFFIRTGSEEKDYRLEVWSGDRTGKAGETNPAGSYVFFDNYSSASVSNYTTLLDETVASVKDKLNEANGLHLGDEGYLGTKDNLPEKDAKGNFLSLYYTFTFFDSPAYLRYDKTADKEELGNPWGSYKQSENSEQLVFLYNMDDGSESGSKPAYSYFLDYSSIDVNVEPDDLSDTDDAEEEESAGSGLSGANILLLVSSGVLVFVLIFVIVIVIVRRIAKKATKKARIKPVKDHRIRPAKKQTEEETPPEAPDENDPYNE